jgi:hypothetical protein
VICLIDESEDVLTVNFAEIWIGAVRVLGPLDPTVRSPNETLKNGKF